MWSELIFIDDIVFATVSEVLPETLDFISLKPFISQRVDCWFELSICNSLLFRLAVLEVDEELESWIAIWEGALDSIFKFNDDLVIPVEGLESIHPIVFDKVALFVGIKFWEEHLG